MNDSCHESENLNTDKQISVNTEKQKIIQLRDKEIIQTSIDNKCNCRTFPY